MERIGLRIFDGRWKEEFYEGDIIRWWGNEHGWRKPSIEILKIVSMPCPRGYGFRVEMFPENKAFLCVVRNMPFKKADGEIDFIDKFCVIGNQGPRHQFVDWCLDPPADYGSGWNEIDLFHETPEDAVADKIKDIENMAKLETLCKYCPFLAGCRERLESLSPVTKALVPKSPKTEIMNAHLQETMSSF